MRKNQKIQPAPRQKMHPNLSLRINNSYIKDVVNFQYVKWYIMYPLTHACFVEGGGTMAYITRKKIKGITYYYAEES